MKRPWSAPRPLLLEHVLDALRHDDALDPSIHTEARSSRVSATKIVFDVPSVMSRNFVREPGYIVPSGDAPGASPATVFAPIAT